MPNATEDQILAAVNQILAIVQDIDKKVTPSTPPSPVPTPVPFTKAFTDYAGNTWGLGNDGQVYENNKLAGYTSQVTNLVLVSGKVYQENSTHNWWYWDGKVWVVTADPTATSTPSTSHQFGFTANAFQSLSATQQSSWLADFKKLGTAWLRMDANWHNIGSSNWSSLDQAVSAAVAAGINVCLVIDGNGQGNMWDAPDPTAYANFCKTVVQRYAAKGVHTYEVWNEPNNTTFWNPSPNAAQYTAVLKAAYTAIKAVDSRSIVLGGGMCPCAIAPIDFLRGMYVSGAHGYFDALSLHPYTYPADPNAGARWQEMNNTNPSLRSIMAANGDSAKQIWITEFGAPTSQYSNAVTEAQQATQLAQAIADVKSYSWAGPMFIYTYLTAETDPQSNEDFFGIVHANQLKKPAYDAVKAAIAA